MTNRTVRDRLLASTIIAGALVAAAPAFAQDAAGVAPPAPPTTPSGLQTSESTTPAPNSQGEIVVTGSLIRNPALTASAPVQVIGQEEVQLRQSNTAEEVLRDLPGAVASIGSAVNNGNGGASFVDLRGLGPNRNVVLLDGRRIAPSGLLGIVDLNNIPLALIQRTDTLTGGAATTYGADAVSGVVNFITRQDFSGAEVNVGKQINQTGDGSYYRADVTIGANFDDGKGNAVFSIGYQHADPVYQGDRDFSNVQISSFSGAGGGSPTTVPAKFTGGGSGTRQINPTTGALGAAGVFNPFNFNPYNVFETPFQRFNMYGAGHYDISDTVEIHSRGLFSKNTVQTILAPAGLFGSSVTINYNNPYLPAAARQQFCTANGLSTAQCNAAAAATGPSDPNYGTFTSTVSRRTPETGSRVTRYTTTIFDYSAGLRVNIAPTMKLDLDGSYGESENQQVITGYLRTSLIRQASLANSTTACTDPSNGCVPLNLFGALGSITPAMGAFLSANSTVITRTSLGQAHALLTGDLGFSSPFANDGISFAAGAEYRKYTASVSADNLSQTPGELSGTGGSTPNVNGAFDVTEGFGEVIAPLVQDKTFFHSLTLEGGFRYSHYSVQAAGSPKFNTKTYKGGATWEPVGGLKFRGNYQRAVRAPNISELFTPVTTGLTNLSSDPCAGAAPLNNANLRAVCLAQGAPANTIGTITSDPQPNETSGGNLNLKPEKANSYTLGVAIPKAYIPGLSLTVDYYHIKVTGAITTPSPADAIAACFGATPTSPSASAASSAACTAIRRNPATGELFGDASTTPGIPLSLSNLGILLTDGIDLGANYRRNLGFAKLNLSFQGNWTRRSKFQATPSAIYRECAGFYSTSCGAPGGTPVGSIQPKFYWNQRTTFTFGETDLSLLWRHVGKVRQEPDDVVNGDGAAFVGTLSDPQLGSLVGRSVNFGKIAAANYFDLTTRVSAGDHLDFTVTVQNLLDRKPPIVGTGVGGVSFNSGNTYPSTYDALGRRFAVAARLKF